MQTVRQRKPREKDEKYLEYIRTKDCITPLCWNSSEPHHLISRGAFGSDYSSVPLCRYHHSEIEATGVSKFEERWGVNVWKEAFKCLLEYFREKIGI